MKAEAINSIVTTGFLEETEVLDFIKRRGKGNLYIVADYGVFLGDIQDKRIVLFEGVPKAEFIQEVRIFTKIMETKITRTKKGFVWRKRSDDERKKTNIDYIEECHKLWGKVTKVEKGFSILQEKRGTTIAIPKRYEKGQKVGLVFRKYISFQDKDFATDQPFSYEIIDERLVAYCEFEEGTKNDN